ncbi:carboxypeptidase-like regulatory domain-containing protein [Arcicella rigui]|uniref:Carboxypeptidase-like regulatory domain-containing protein n=1 Tax=Arcicella rigui TaxID=797020 RepID=A0ABU5QCI8_9BACT|nr:carboxypeptidase-like regulatory domain-containing protein [Arcicella rigui]MEA5140570.1 carboxypeptidase-like regulatory domain-containing protein [Arcicella rigui]
MLLKLKHIFIIAIIICLSNFSSSFGQGQDKSVVFSGRVVADRSSEFLPNAYVFNPQSGRGTLTDDFGNFSLYVYPGDSVVFSYVGYKKKYYIIPRTNDFSHVATIFMTEDSKLLAEVKIYPYRTEDEFKKAFLDMKLENEAGRRALAKNLEQSKLNVLAMRAGLSGAGNFRNFSDQMTYAATNRGFYQSPVMALTNPFAWMNFIKSIKNGDLKRDDYKKAYEDAPTEGISRQKFLKEQKTGN